MKKFLAAAAVALVALTASACNNQPASSADPTKTEVTEYTTQPTEKPTETAYGKVKVQQETIKKSTLSKTKKKTTTKATEQTESTVPTTMPPTQGVTKAGRTIVVTTVKGSFSSSDLDFVYKNVTIKLNDKVEDVFTKLGDETYEEPTEKNNIYDFDDFEIFSYVEEGVERIEKIVVVNEKLSTAKGATIGMYASRLRRIYGDPRETTKTEYIFGTETKTLSFSYEDNIVTGITYTLKRS